MEIDITPFEIAKYVTENQGTQDILGYINSLDPGEFAKYIKDYTKFDLDVLIDNNDDAMKLLYAVVDFLSPNRTLDKDSFKKEINLFIDDWYV